MYLILLIYFIIVGIPAGFFYWFGLDFVVFMSALKTGQYSKVVMLIFVYYGFHLFLWIRVFTSRRKLLYIIASCLIWVIAIGGCARNAMIIHQEYAEKKKQKAEYQARLHGETELSPHLKAMSVNELLDSLKGLENNDWLDRRERQRAIREMGDAAIPELIQTLKNSEEARTRLEAAIVLGTIGAGAERAVPALISALEDSDKKVRHDAVVTLGKIGPAAHAAIPFLVAAMKENEGDQEHLVNSQLPWTLVKIGSPETVLPVLVEVSRGPKGKVQHTAAKALKYLREKLEAKKRGLQEKKTASPLD